MGTLIYARCLSRTAAKLQKQMKPNTLLLSPCDDMQTGCFGLWCPCVLYAKTNVIIHETDFKTACLSYCCCLPPTICFYAPKRRATWRAKLLIDDGECYGDYLTWICCCCLANCQEYRELEIRGMAAVEIHWDEHWD